MLQVYLLCALQCSVVKKIKGGFFDAFLIIHTNKIMHHLHLTFANSSRGYTEVSLPMFDYSLLSHMITPL
jgi:hypothetical protein